MAESGEQGTENVERRPHLSNEVVGSLSPDNVRRVDENRCLIEPVRLRAERVEQIDHDLRIADAGNVSEGDFTVGEQSARHNGDRGVLAAARSNSPRQAPASFNNDLIQSSGVLVLSGPARGRSDRLRAGINGGFSILESANDCQMWARTTEQLL